MQHKAETGNIVSLPRWQRIPTYRTLKWWNQARQEGQTENVDISLLWLCLAAYPIWHQIISTWTMDETVRVIKTAPDAFMWRRHRWPQKWTIIPVTNILPGPNFCLWLEDKLEVDLKTWYIYNYFISRNSLSNELQSPMMEVRFQLSDCFCWEQGANMGTTLRGRSLL